MSNDFYETDDALQNVNHAIKESTDFTYLLILDRASWADALTKCESFGFYLADLTEDEITWLKNWLASFSISEPYGKLACHVVRHLILSNDLTQH